MDEDFVSMWSTKKCLEPLLKGWPKRICFVGKHIAALPVSEVHDFGCGNAQLKKHLPSSVRYIGYDVVLLTSDVLYLDLRGNLPDLKPAGTSVAAFIGVLESLRSERVPEVLSWTLSHFDYLLLTYNQIRLSKRPEWSCHLTKSQILGMLEKLSKVDILSAGPSSVVCLCSRIPSVR